MLGAELRHRIELQSQGATQDPDTGEMIVGWVSEGKVWARVTPLSVRDFIQSAAGQVEVSARIKIRYRADVTGTWRALFRGKVYNLHGTLADADSGLEYLTIPASEGVNDGR